MKPKEYINLFKNKKFILNTPNIKREKREFEVKKFKYILIKNILIYELYRKQNIKNRNRSFYFK
jgi:hypothetical protein